MSGASVLGSNQMDSSHVGTPPPVLRQIHEHNWVYGEEYLRDHPNQDEVEVFFHHWIQDMKWQFKVARVGNQLVRQTWLNGILLNA